MDTWRRSADAETAPLAYLRVSVMNDCRTALRNRSRLRLWSGCGSGSGSGSGSGDDLDEAAKAGLADPARLAESASGKQLAVATDAAQVTGGPLVKGLTVFSVATGRALHSWSTQNATAFIPAAWTAGVTPSQFRC
jgi:hypothetical protein